MQQQGRVLKDLHPILRVQSVHDSITTTTSTTQASGVLTRSVISSLVTDLDAGDVLECYALTRKTKSHVSATTNNSIAITKAALGLRQHSVGVENQQRHDHDKPLELTPTRVQATVATQESTTSEGTL